jgi:hypothetical protein
MALFPLGILSAAGAEVAGPAYELIESTILTGTQASITFSNLGTYSSTYKHLQIRATHKSSSSDDFFLLRFNGDTGSNYAWHQLGGEGSVVFSGGATSQTAITAGQNPSTTASRFAATVIDLLDVYSTTKNKTIRLLTGNADVNKVILRSGVFLSTASTTSLTLSVTNFTAGSRFSLYGIKG